MAPPQLDPFPESVAALVDEGEWTPLVAPRSIAAFRVARPDRTSVRCAFSDDPWGRDLLDAESERLAWLRGRLGTPDVLAHDRQGSVTVLVTTLPPGTDAADPMARFDGDSLVVALAQGLRAIHDLDPSSCPFDASVPVLLDLARRRVAGSTVGVGDLSEPYARHEPRALLEHLDHRQPPPADDAVVIHGAYRLHNVFVDARAATGCLDWGRGGVGDRYADLAVMARDLGETIGPDAVAAFLDAYGVEPMLARIEFHDLLGELVR